MPKLSFTDKQFREVHSTAKKIYAQIDTVYCPYLACAVHFSVKGFDHVTMKKWNHVRGKKDRYLRLKLIHHAPEVLKRSHTLQGIYRTKHFERIKINSRWEKVLKEVVYYEFMAVISNVRVKIIVKEIVGGTPLFWSIIPFWRQSRFGKKLYDGNPETD